VKVTTREGLGETRRGPEPRPISAARVEQTEKARQQAWTFKKHEFNYALKAVSERADENLGDVVSTKNHHLIAKTPDCSAKRKPSERTSRQFKSRCCFWKSARRARKNLPRRAMAVAALKKEAVARIILTRPAVEAGERSVSPG